jgi:hypothetical protein
VAFKKDLAGIWFDQSQQHPRRVVLPPPPSPTTASVSPCDTAQTCPIHGHELPAAPGVGFPKGSRFHHWFSSHFVFSFLTAISHCLPQLPLKPLQPN